LIRRYFLVFYLQILKVVLQIRKTFYAVQLYLNKKVFIHHLLLKISAPFSWKQYITLLEFNNKYEQAIKLCKKRLKKDNQNRSFLNEVIARNYRNLNKIDEAFEYLDKAKDGDYNVGSIHYEHGLICFISGDYLKAKKSLEYAIKEGYDSIPLQIHLGKIYYKLNLLDKAELCLRKVLNIYPKEGSIHFLMGVVLKNNKNYEEAETAFLRAIEYGSDHKEEHLGLAEIYTRNGNWDKAIREYKHISLIDPKSFVAHYFLGLIYEIQGRDSEAIKALIVANKINPDDKDTKEKLTKLLESTPQ